VLAAVVADRQHHGADPAVADAKSLARHAGDVRLAAGRPVEGDVADNDVRGWIERRTLRRIDDDLAAGQPLTEIVVGIAFQSQGDAGRNKGAEALAGRSLEVETDRILRQTDGAEAACHLAAENGADHSIDIADGQCRRNRRAVLEYGLAQG